VRACVTGVVELVSACCHANTMSFCLLVGSDIAYEVCIGDFVVLGHLGFLDEKYGAGAFDLFGDWTIRTNAVGEESAPFVG
jgi:hypothetical protein